MNLNKILIEVASVSKDVGKYLLHELNQVSPADIVTKSKNDFVTYVDKGAEKILIKELSKIFPEAGFIAEESFQMSSPSRYHWVVDPLDGTTNFIHKHPPFAVSIALTDHHKEILGVIYEPNLDECFSSHIESFSFLNNEKIRVSDCYNLNSSLLATGFPSRDYSKLDAYLEVFKELMFETQGIRRLGSAAIDLAYVACGRLDGFFEYHLNVWDVAAGCIIIKQAGGRLSDFSGSSDYLFGREIIATNNKIHSELENLIKSNFNK